MALTGDYEKNTEIMVTEAVRSPLSARSTYFSLEAGEWRMCATPPVGGSVVFAQRPAELAASLRQGQAGRESTKMQVM